MRHAAPVAEEPVGQAASAAPSARAVPRRGARLQFALIGALALVLLGVVALAAAREANLGSQRVAPTPVPASGFGQAARPPFGPAEQQYLESLWPIHVEVERAAVRLALGAAFYRVHDIERTELKRRLDEAQDSFTAAAHKLDALAPPPEAQRSHEAYAEAVRLFAASTTEMLKMFDDGDEEHLVQGFPLSQQGSDRIREIGARWFPDEYPPN
jgi:hypothetical protein